MSEIYTIGVDCASGVLVNYVDETYVTTSFSDIQEFINAVNSMDDSEYIALYVKTQDELDQAIKKLEFDGYQVEYR